MIKPKILFAKGGVGGKLGHRPAEADLALLDDIGAVGDRLAEMQVLLAQQHRQPLAFERADRLGHLLDDDRRQPFRRLVEQHAARIAHQGAGDGQHLLLAARHAPARPLAHAAEIGKQREQPVLGPGRRAVARRLAADLEILHHRQLGEDAPLLRHIAQAEPGDAVGRQAVDAPAGEAHLAAAPAAPAP